MISIICACNNEELFNKMLLPSIEKQTIKDYEIIKLNAKELGLTGAAQTLNYGAKIANFCVRGVRIQIIPEHIYKISSLRRKHIDAKYADFSLENEYGIHILKRNSSQEMQAMFEPWMLPEKDNQPGVVDFKPTKRVANIENLWTWHMVAMLSTIQNKKILEF